LRKISKHVIMFIQKRKRELYGRYKGLSLE
jgi:hypothetical protein